VESPLEADAFDFCLELVPDFDVDIVRCAAEISEVLRGSFNRSILLVSLKMSN
jgi:hypothetical protein